MFREATFIGSEPELRSDTLVFAACPTDTSPKLMAFGETTSKEAASALDAKPLSEYPQPEVSRRKQQANPMMILPHQPLDVKCCELL
ncbi:MAG TPA: hypothetical protein VHT24_14335 [Pseudacidobacterium sp.]|jgi:hypothetical protein|nr:hypothetical protein [Pseudacidobacterium sp.]